MLITLPLGKRVSNFTLGIIPRYVLRMAIQPNIGHRNALSSYSKRYNLGERCEFAAERSILKILDRHKKVVLMFEPLYLKIE